MRGKMGLVGGYVWRGAGFDLERSTVLISNGLIEAVLPESMSDTLSDSTYQLVDVRDLLLLPPLFDCHVHSTSTLLRGTENSLPLELWSYYAINYGRNLTDDAIYCSTLLTALEMIRNGIGGYIDHYPPTHRAEVGLAAHVHSGLRVGFAPFFADLRDENILDIPLDRDVIKKIAPLAPTNSDRIRAIYSDLDIEVRSKANGRIALLAGPNSPQRSSPKLWKLWQDLQENFVAGSHTHLLETYPQSLAAKKRWPNGVVQALAEHGLLSDRLSVAHGVWIDQSERELLASHGVTISYNPQSNGMLGSGWKRIREDLEAGVNISLGTDCSNTGGRHDLFEIMRHMLLSGRDAGSNFADWIQPREALNAATNNAGGLGQHWGGGGLIEPNRAADILFINVKSFGLAAAPIALESIVVHADPRNVHSLMVGGEWLLRDGVITAFDEALLLAKADRLAEELRETASQFSTELASLRDPYKDWQDQVFEQRFCPHCSARVTPKDSG